MRKYTLLAVLLAAASANAQNMDYLQSDEVQAAAAAKVAEAKAAEAKADGWVLGVQLGSSIALNNTQNVAGTVTDGTTLQVGAVLGGKANLKKGNHEWQNNLNANFTLTRTPVMGAFIKTADNLEIKTSYLYAFEAVPWLGPFARARMQTQMWKTQLIYVDPTDLVQSDHEGVIHLGAEQRYTAANPFEPVQLRESAGFFARPADSKTIKAIFTLGAGAEEVLTGDGYAIDDNGDTPEIELKKLENSQELGLEIDAAAEGYITDEIFWSVGANMLQPFVYSGADDVDLEGIELANIEFNAKIGIKLSKWLSLDYTFNAKRVPLVLDEWQITNGLLLSAAFEVNK